MNENELDNLTNAYTKLTLEKKVLVDNFIIAVGCLCVNLYKNNKLIEAFDRLMSDSAQRSDWIYLRNFRNQNFNMDDYGLLYIKDNCAGEYLAYLGVSIGLDIADKVYDKEIIRNYLRIGELLDEHPIKNGMTLNDLLRQIEVKENYLKFLKFLSDIIFSINNNLKINNMDRLQEIHILLKETIQG